MIQTGGPFIVLATLTILMWMRLRQTSENGQNLIESTTTVEDDPSAAFVGATRYVTRKRFHSNWESNYVFLW